METTPQRYLAHLDILGMRTLTKQNHHAAWNMLSALETALLQSTPVTIKSDKFDDPIHIPDLIKSVMFSDTIIIYTESNTPRDFYAIFTAALNLFSKALYYRVPIRVGISKGIFHADKVRSMYAGPALIEAYDIGEASQWLGIVLSPSVAKDAIAQNLRRGNTSLVIDWELPTKEGTIRATVANWPVALESSFKITPPLTTQQLYSVFEEYYGPFSELHESVMNKYTNTVDFINEQYKLYKQL
ncbi:MAG: hypothetical protein V4672_22600 [Verrucomicrobiota bacterium]